MTISRSFFGRSAAALALVGLCAGPLAPTAAFAADEEDTALLAYLGLTAAEGKTELGDKAGELEAAFLMDMLLGSLGEAVRGKVNTATAGMTGITVIPLADAEKIDLRALDVVKTRIELIKNQVAGVDQSLCKIKKANDNKGGDSGNEAGIDTSFGGLAQAVLGAVKTDTKYSGIVVTNGRDAVMDAITSVPLANMGRWFIPSERQFSNRTLAADLASPVQGARNALARCKDSPVQKAQLDAALALADSLTAPGKDGAPSLLEQAIPLENLVPGTTYVLRVAQGKAGGSLANRSNIWTTIGVVNGLTVRGGVTASWRLTKADTGDIVGSGTIRCATPAVAFKDVHRTTKTTTCGSSGS